MEKINFYAAYARKYVQISEYSKKTTDPAVGSAAFFEGLQPIIRLQFCLLNRLRARNHKYYRDQYSQ